MELFFKVHEEMNFLARFLKKSPKDFFLNYNPKNFRWSVVSWNFDLQKTQERTLTLEIHDSEISQVSFIKTTQERLVFVKNAKIKQSFNLKENRQEALDLMNLAMHSTIKVMLERHHPFLLTPVTGATSLDLQNESKALQWVQVTFSTLIKSFERLEKDKSLILTSTIFSGLTPDTNEDVLRIIIFNLDIFYYFRPDGSLEIVVFDDKNFGHGESKQPIFHQIIKVAKPQFYDEIYKVVKVIGIAGEVV